MADEPANQNPPAAAGNGNAPPATPRPAPASTPDPDDPEAGVDDVVAGLSVREQATRARQRLEASRQGWRTRAQTAESELQSARQRVQQLEAQTASVTQLRSSLVASALRATATGVVAPEGLEDAIKLIDTSDLVVADDGTIDLGKVKAKVEAFVKDRPHFAPGRGTQPQPLSGVHGTPPRSAGNLSHAGFNDLVRQAAGRS